MQTCNLLCDNLQMILSFASTFYAVLSPPVDGSSRTLGSDTFTVKQSERAAQIVPRLPHKFMHFSCPA